MSTWILILYILGDSLADKSPVLIPIQPAAGVAFSVWLKDHCDQVETHYKGIKALFIQGFEYELGMEFQTEFF